MVGASKQHGGAVGDDVDTCPHVGAVAHHAFGLLGLAIVLVILASAYSIFYLFAQGFGVLASTAIVFAVLLLWVGVWLSMEVAWTRRTA
ncbi:hypothetical protein [Haladaptatus sp. DJG-WS-42]|uniref:hypothetical protein n=1 Tax=Haladaptatus sp. DJG-WS-42 TaxID=3120516 RepID=UPI0030CAB2E0